eukprot:GHVU01196370.1.p1 GENE.GHVU01196370.1~~GHVU01196370.1.p1  ORF type:complete len:504 (+),score=89.69 GHVU01196370.1:782-2293(+)
MSATPEATSSGIVEAEGAPSEGPREGAGGGASMRRSSGAGEPLLPPSGAATGPNEQWGEAAGPATGDGKNECGQDDAENDRRGSVATFDGTVDGATRNGCGSRDIDMRTCKAWPENPHERKVFWTFMALKGVVLTLLALAMWFCFTHGELLLRWLTVCLNWLASLGWGGPVLFALFYVVSTIIFFPAEILTLSSGYLFSQSYGKIGGCFLAFFICTVSQYASMVPCFYTARYLLKAPCDLCCLRYPLYTAFSTAVKDGGFIFVGLLRLSSVVPFTLLNYFLGATELGIETVLLGSTALGPINALLVWVGSELVDVREIAAGTTKKSWTRYLLFGLGAACTIAAIAYVTYLTKKRLTAALASGNQEGSGDQEGGGGGVAAAVEDEEVEITDRSRRGSGSQGRRESVEVLLEEERRRSDLEGQRGDSAAVAGAGAAPQCGGIESSRVREGSREATGGDGARQEAEEASGPSNASGPYAGGDSRRQPTTRSQSGRRLSSDMAEGLL